MKRGKASEIDKITSERVKTGADMPSDLLLPLFFKKSG